MPNKSNLKPPWKPGQSGNPKGRPKKRPFADELEKQIAKDPEKLSAVVQSALTEAGKGNTQAMKMISEIMDGKPMQQVMLSGDEENPINVKEITYRVIDPSSGDT